MSQASAGHLRGALTGRARRFLARLGLALLACALVPGADGVAAKKKGRPSTEDAPIACHDVAVVGELALLAQTLGLSLWDIGDPLRPRATERLPLPGTVLGVTAAPPLVYLAAGPRGLYVARMVEDGPPRVVSRFETPGSVRQVKLHGSHALLADARHGLRVVDVSDPARPLQKALVSTRDEVRSLALRGDVLAVAEGKAGVRLLDVSRPERPLELHVLRDMDDARDVAFAGARLLVAAGGEGLWVYGLDSERPSRLGRLDVERAAEFVGGDGGLALVSNGTPTIALVAIDERGLPRSLGGIRVHRSAPALRVHVHGSTGIAALERAGLALIDLTDPLAPVVLLPRERELKIEWP